MSSTPAPEIADASETGALRICSFESRRSQEMRSLIERKGGIATIAPSMREIPIGENPAALHFAEELFAGNIDLVILMTGVGTEALLAAIETQFEREQFFDALRAMDIVIRGPKPAAVLRRWKIPFRYQAPEPNTWEQVIEVIDENLHIADKTVAIQEYGLANDAMYEELRARQATVLPVPVYRWALPLDTEPLMNAIRQTIDGQFDVLMFTSAQQLHNTLDVAESAGLQQEWMTAAAKTVVASIGPTASEHLRSVGLPVDLEPSHPKMGHLVQETIAAAAEILERKRSVE